MTEHASADSLYKLYENCDPDLLKRTRQAAGMDEGVLARRACLSTAQVRQLESGGDGLFYSITIKRQAYKRLMMVLGAEPPTHTPYAPENDAVAVAASPLNHQDTINNIVALSSKSEYLEKRPVKDFFLDLRFRVQAHRQFLAALLFLLSALVIMVWNWQTLRQAATTSMPNVAEASVPSLTSASTSARPANASSPDLAAHSVAPSVVPASVAPAATGAVVTPSETAVATASSDKSLKMTEGSCEFVDKLAEVMSASASRPANYVYVVSPADTVVCVVDGSKKATVLNLKANEGRSVYGNPPWQISSRGLKDTQVFFQGVRVKGPEGHELHFALIEKTTTP